MPAKFAARNYCSRTCAGVAKRKTPPVKPCEVCGKLFNQVASQRLHRFIKKKYCSVQCAGVAQQNDIRDILQRIQPDPITGCHVWTGRKDWRGYGRTSLEGRDMMVHRAVWEHYKGPVPEGLHLDHICRNTSCCNVDHLRAVTPKVNSLAGYSPAAQYARRENCDKCGGPFSHFANGYRYCKPCRTAKMLEYQNWRRAQKKDGGDGVKYAVIPDHQARKEAAQRRAENTKACLECGTTFTAAYGQWSAFKRQKYCSPECARKHDWDNRKVDDCPKCGTPYSTFPSGKRYCKPCAKKTTELRKQKEQS